MRLLIQGELTQGQIAQQIGVGLRTLSRWRCEVLKETVDTTRHDRYEQMLAMHLQQYMEVEQHHTTHNPTDGVAWRGSWVQEVLLAYVARLPRRCRIGNLCVERTATFTFLASSLPNKLK